MTASSTAPGRETISASAAPASEAVTTTGPGSWRARSQPSSVCRVRSVCHNCETRANAVANPPPTRVRASVTNIQCGWPWREVPPAPKLSAE